MVSRAIREESSNRDARNSGEFHGHELCAAIVRSCDDAIISYSLRGGITSWNPGAERLLGYSAEEVAGTPIAALIPTDKQAEATEVFNRLRKGLRVEPYESLLRRKDGSLAELSLTVSPIKDGDGRIIGVSMIARDITDLKQTRNQLTVLVGEMRHRVRNFGAIIEALGRSALPKDSPATVNFFSVLMGRVRALLSAGDIVLSSSQRQANFEDLVRTSLGPFLEAHANRFRIDGPRLVLSEQAAGGLALAFHELATNALKYGALKDARGKIELTWTVTGSTIRIVWKEHLGNALSAPSSRGFGSQLIKTAVASERECRTEMTFEPDGLNCVIEFALRS